MPESHIAHAVAVFSELGIATSSILISDAPKWRAIVKAGRADPVAVNDLLVQAKKLGWFYYSVNRIICHDQTRFFIQYLLPFLGLCLGCFALIGIAYYPKSTIDLLTFSPQRIDDVYLILAVASFVVSFFAAIIEKSNAKVAYTAESTVKTNIP